jgi:hypothetical protein
MSSNRLKLNPEKTQFAWFGSQQQLQKVDVSPFVMPDGSVIQPTLNLCGLGVLLDPQLSMEAHANRLLRCCSFQLRQLRCVRTSLTTETATALVHAFISCRVDYCNSLFYCANSRVTRKLQSILNSAARLITGHRLYDHITPVLRDELHWLPVEQRLTFKVALMVRNCLRGTGPVYLSRMLMPVTNITDRRHLRSAEHGDLSVVNYRTERFGARSFRRAGPAVWNALPASVRDLTLSNSTFKNRLKTHLFNVAFG